MPPGARCLVAGIDLVRDGDGTYRVLEDNLRNPSGISYVLENRAAMTRVLPSVFARPRVRPSTTTARSLLDALRQVAPAGVGRPDGRRAHARRLQLAPTSSTRSWPGRWASSSSRAATSSSTTTSCRCARRTGLAARRRHLPPHRRRLPRPGGVPPRLDAGRARSDGRGPGRQRDASRTPWATAWPTTRRCTPTCPTSSATTWARSRSSRTSRPTCCGTTTSAPQVLDRLDELVVKPVAESGGYGMLIGPARVGRGARRRAASSIEADPRGLHRAGGRVAVAAPDAASTITSRAATSTCARSCCRARASR